MISEKFHPMAAAAAFSPSPSLTTPGTLPWVRKISVLPLGAGVFSGVVTGMAVGAFAYWVTIACAAARDESVEPLDAPEAAEPVEPDEPPAPPGVLEVVEEPPELLQAANTDTMAAAAVTATTVRERRGFLCCSTLLSRRAIVCKAVTPVL